MADRDEVQAVYEGRHLSMVKRGRWEYATRNTQRPAVGIVAITDEGKAVLVEQFRPPVAQAVVELPAGLAGDLPGREDETLVEAAQRELLEETGYSATGWRTLGSYAVDGNRGSGTAYFFLARAARQIQSPDADDLEEQEFRLLPVAEVRAALLRGEFKVLPWTAVVALALLALEQS